MKTFVRLAALLAICVLPSGASLTLAADPNEPNDTSATATVRVCGFSQLDTEIEPLEDVDWYRITGTPGEVMSIDIDADEIGSTLDSIIQAHDSALVVLEFSDDDPAPGEGASFDSFVSVIVPGDGIVLLAVGSFSDTDFDGGGDSLTTGFYEIHTSCAPGGDANEPNDDFAEATPLTCPGGVQVVEITPGDVDYYLLTAPAGTQVFIDIDADENGSTLDSLLGTFDNNFSPLDVSDDDPAPGEAASLDSYLEATVPVGDELYIAVGAFNDVDFDGGPDSFSDGPYTLTIRCCSDLDGDGFGSPASAACNFPEGDCDDTDPEIKPVLFMVNLLQNGNFESGTLAGWNVFDQFSNGTTFASTPGDPTPLNGFPTAPNPVGGTTYAVTDQVFDDAHALIQSFTVPADTYELRLSFDLFVNDQSGVGPIVHPAGLDASAVPNQHARVDILPGGSAPFDTASVLDNYYLGVDPGPTPNPYTHYEFDILATAVPGGTYDLRFAQVQNVFFLNMGVDNVRVLARLRHREDCNNGIDDDCDGLIDDDDPRCDPLVAELEAFTAEATPRGVVVQWTTSREVDHAGFRVLRQAGSQRSKRPEAVSLQVIPAQGADLLGASYEFVDRHAPAGEAWYWLESIDNDGATEMFGPVVVEVPVSRQAPAREVPTRQVQMRQR